MLEQDEKALRAAIIISHNQNKFYLLIDKERGLCEARRVNVDFVFFLATFRDDAATAKGKRVEEWSKKIRDFKSKLEAAGRPVARQKILRDDARVAVERKRNFTNELQGLLATYLRDPESSCWRRCRRDYRRRIKICKSDPLGARQL